MDDSVDLNLLAFLHEQASASSPADVSMARENPMFFHLRECKSVALRQARKTFVEYQKELDHAFSLDLDEACSVRAQGARGRAAKVLDEFRQDVKHMTDTITELTEVTQHILARQQALSQRAEISNRGLDRLRAAKLRVYKQVSERTSQEKLPSAVLLFLLQPWTDYLCFTDLRFGEGSPAWHQALAVMDKLIWAVAPKSSAGEQAMLAQLRGPLQDCIGAGLRTIRYDGAKARKLQDALEILFDRASACMQVETTDESLARSLKTRAARHALRRAPQYVPPKNPEEILEREVMSHLRRLEFGAEFRFGNRRMRLAWANGKTSRYMLVDEHSGASRLMSGRELARALLGKKALLLTADPTRASRGKRNGERGKNALRQFRAACWSFF